MPLIITHIELKNIRGIPPALAASDFFDAPIPASFETLDEYWDWKQEHYRGSTSGTELEMWLVFTDSPQYAGFVEKT